MNQPVPPNCWICHGPVEGPTFRVGPSRVVETRLVHPACLDATDLLRAEGTPAGTLVVRSRPATASDNNEQGAART